MRNDPSEPVRLMREYLAAEYRATLDGREAILQVGARPPQWLQRDDLVFLTAWNPRSTPRGDAENRIALAALRTAIEPFARVHDALGTDARRTWHEPSLLAIGLPL